MKCKECNACHRGWFKSKPDAYYCAGVQEPFAIDDINGECTAYASLRDKKPDDGVYIELFAVKNGVRYNHKVVSIKDVSTTLTNNLVNGIEELFK